MTDTSVPGDLVANIRSFVEDELVFRPNDTMHEARANMMSFSFQPPVDEVAVRQALLDVGHALREHVGAGTGPIAFYSWYDEMAGYLGCSVASVQLDDLPFWGAIRVVDGPAEVVRQMAADPHPGTIPWNEFVEVDRNASETEPDDEPDREPAPVFATLLRR